MDDLINVDLIGNRIWISNKGEKLNCNIDISVDNKVWNIKEYSIEKNLDGCKYSSWHQPNIQILDNSIIKVILRDNTKKHDADPYSEEEWDDDIILEKSWKVHYNVEEI